MATKMTFDEYDTIILTYENGEVIAFSFVDSMDVLEDALEEIVPKNLENIRNAYEGELDKAQGEKAENDAYQDYLQSIKELLQKNWDAVYAIVADELLI